jgi:transposase-like protein
MYRRAPIDLLYERARGYLSISREIGLSLNVDLKEFKTDPRPGRRGRPDVFYAELAKQYVDLLAEGSTPTKDLAERLGYSASSIRDLIHQARRRGLLTRASKGLAGGELTENARRLLSIENGGN